VVQPLQGHCQPRPLSSHSPAMSRRLQFAFGNLLPLLYAEGFAERAGVSDRRLYPKFLVSHRSDAGGLGREGGVGHEKG